MSWERLMSDAGKGAAMWKEIAEYQRLPLVELFGSDPDRVSRFTVEESGLLFDFSKTHLTPDLMAAFGRLAAAQGLSTMRDRLFMGEIDNPSENRAAEHGAERGSAKTENGEQIGKAQNEPQSP